MFTVQQKTAITGDRKFTKCCFAKVDLMLPYDGTKEAEEEEMLDATTSKKDTTTSKITQK